MIFLITDNNSLHDKDKENNDSNKSNQKLKTIRITEYEQTTVFYSDREDGKCNVYMEVSILIFFYYNILIYLLSIY